MHSASGEFRKFNTVRDLLPLLVPSLFFQVTPPAYLALMGNISMYFFSFSLI